MVCVVEIIILTHIGVYYIVTLNTSVLGTCFTNYLEQILHVILAILLY